MTKTRNTLKWNCVDDDYVAKTPKFIIRLKKVRVGVYAMGEGYGLRIRKVDEVKETKLGYCFWTRKDGGYDTYVKDSVGKKIWTSDTEVMSEAEKILKGLDFIPSAL